MERTSILRTKSLFLLVGLCAELLVPSSGVAKETPQLVLPIGHTDLITSVAFSPDGQYVLSGSVDKTMKLWEVATGREIRAFKGHESTVESVAFSPDGKFALSGSFDRTIRLWEVATGREIRTFKSHKNDCYSIAFSPDGKYVLSGGTMKLWEVATGREIRAFKGHTQWIYSETFHTQWIYSVAFSPDGKYAASGSRDQMMKLWEVTTGREIRTFTFAEPIFTWPDCEVTVAFSPDGKYVLFGLGDKMKLWEVATGREIRAFVGHAKGVFSASFSPDGKYILSGSLDHIMKLWEVATGREIRSFIGHAKGVSSIAFNPDGKYAVSGSRDHTMKLWEVATGREIRTLTGHTPSVYSMALSTDGRLALTGGEKVLKVWEMTTGRELHAFEGVNSRILCVAFSPDGNYALSGDLDGKMKLWEVSTGREIRAFTDPAEHVWSVAFSPDGNYALSGGWNGKLKLWEVSTGREIRTFKGHESTVQSVAFSPDGKYILSGVSLQVWSPSGPKNLVKLWEVVTGREVRSFKEHKAGARAVAFSPDGRHVFFGATLDGTITMAETETGREIRTFEGHTSSIYSLAFSPDGQYVLSGSADQTLKLWEVATGREIRAFEGHSNEVYSAVFSPDGKYILSGSADQSLKMWDASTGKLLFTRLHLDKSDWVAVTPDGRFDGSADGMDLMHFAQDNRSIPLDALFERFYTPNLVARVLSGEREEKPQMDIRQGIAPPPLVTITHPQPDQSFTTKALEITVQATDQRGGIEDIRLYHNGKLVRTEQRGLKAAPPRQDIQTRTFTVTLLTGENRFRATAFSRARTEAHSFELRVFLEAPQPTTTLYILGVGINQYKNPKYSLNYARKDAEGVVDALQRRGKAIFKTLEVTTLYDRQATRARLVDALQSIGARAQAEDAFIFFYAGHGVMSEGMERPSDYYFALSDMTQLYGRDDLLVREGLSATELKEICAGIEARKQLLIMDACQSGGAVETFALRGAAEEKAILQLARSAGVVVLASAGAEQFASEVKTLGHGVFTYVLLQALTGQADGAPMDGKITIRELTAYVESEIPRVSEQHRGEPQYPNIYARGQDFPVVLTK